MAQIQITDFEKWGKLLKAWAKGETPLPKTPQELKNQMGPQGVMGIVPDEIKSIQFITPDDNTLVILMPPREAIEKAEALLGNGGPYPLPEFYKRAFGGGDARPADLLTFNAQRIGEYTTLFCQ